MYTEYLRALKKVPYTALEWSGWRSRAASCRRYYLSSEVHSSGVMFIKEKRKGKSEERDGILEALRMLLDYSLF